MRFVRSSCFAGLLVVALMLAPGRVKAQAVAFQPGIGVIPDGVSLSVTPVVSADRRYVRLSLLPQFQTIDGFTNFPIPAAIAGGGNGGGGGLGGNGAGGLRSVGLGPADFAYWYPDLGVPLDDYRPPVKPLKASTSRSKKPLPDPEIVPIKKKK